MKFILALGLATSLAAIFSGAHRSVDQFAAQHPEHNQSEVSNPSADPVQNVNLVLQPGMTSWHDPRGPLSQKAAELGLSASDVKRIRETVGYVLCPGNKGVGASSNTAMLIGNGGQVVTIATTFIDPDTNQRHEPLSDCVFINQSDYKPVKLDFSNNSSYKFYTIAPKIEWYNNRAIARLTKTNTLQPIMLDSAPLKPGDEVMMVSASQDGLTFPDEKIRIELSLSGGLTGHTDIYREPIAQSCKVVSYYAATSIASSVVYTDCNSLVGGGSVIMVRNAGGYLVAKALLVEEGDPAANYKPFKVGKGVPLSDLSFALTVGLDSNVEADIEKMEKLH